MHVALIQDDSIVAVGHYSKIFPNTSFGPSGPSAEFLEENSAKLVTNAFAYDPATHRLEDCPAYFVNDHVSTKRVVELTEWEVNQKSENSFFILFFFKTLTFLIAFFDIRKIPVLT